MRSDSGVSGNWQVGASRGAVRCTRCGQLLYNHEKRQHLSDHRERDRVAAINRELLGHDGRERLWTEGDDVVRSAKTNDELIRGGEMMLRKYHDRGYERAIDSGWGTEYPSLEQFFRAAAEVDVLERPEVSALLRAKYAHVPHPGGAIARDGGWIPVGTVRRAGVVHCVDGNPRRAICGASLGRRPVASQTEQVDCVACLAAG